MPRAKQGTPVLSQVAQQDKTLFLRISTQTTTGLAATLSASCRSFHCNDGSLATTVGHSTSMVLKSGPPQQQWTHLYEPHNHQCTGDRIRHATSMSTSYLKGNALDAGPVPLIAVWLINLAPWLSCHMCWFCTGPCWCGTENETLKKTKTLKRAKSNYLCLPTSFSSCPGGKARPVFLTNSSAVPRCRPTPVTSYLRMDSNSSGVMKRV